MAESTSTRKSGRQRVPNKKYSNDAFEVLNVVLSSDSEDDVKLQQQLLQDDSDEFPVDQLVGEQEDDEDSLAGDVSDGSEVLTPVEEYEDAHSYASSDSGSLGGPQPGKSKARRKRIPRDTNSHSRGMPEKPLRKELTHNVVGIFTGEGAEDLSHFVKSVDQWAADPMLPRRSQLCHGFSHTAEKRQMEASVGWDWYYEYGGREIIAQRQSLQSLTPDEAVRYTESTSTEQDFIMGSYGKQKHFDLSSLQALELDKAWEFADNANSEPMRQRHGWMLNAGKRVKCLDWAPNHNREMQYLAVATAQLFDSQNPSEEPPAFTPLIGPSAIQIWGVPIALHGQIVGNPSVRIVLCTDWGEIRQLKWCPVPRTMRDQATSEESVQSRESIGLLAAIFSDGFARVLEVQLEQREPPVTYPQAIKYTSPAFEARPLPNNLNTCLTWLSATDLAIGDSSGHLAIYDICPEPFPRSSDASKENTSQKVDAEHLTEPIPWLSVVLHSTYILALASAYPTHPSLLMSSSLSGHLRLTSLLAPTMDFVVSARTYTPPSSLVYCDSVLSAVWIEESSETMKLSGLRCFYTSLACQRLPAPPGPGPCVVDAGKCHSSVAAGGADGSVIVTNPQGKILSKRTDIVYQQCIFKHEWRPTTQVGENEGPQRQGMSRITEGYLPERVWLGTKNTFGKRKETVPTTTIYEEETAVTALAWNPNVSCGGWLAVGWGSGLIRVQDVALD